MVIRKLTKLDLPFLLEIRNHESTRVNLENDSVFDLEQCEQWFKNLKSPWYIIEVDNIPVGYIRTEDDYVGIDIHINHRRKGYAKKAFKKYLKNKQHAKLWVFNDNFAKELYLELGFIENGNFKTIRDRQYVEMEYYKIPNCKVAKVLAFYFGDRRHYPHNKEGVINLFKKQINAHSTLNPGVNMDLIIINHDTQDQEVYDLLNQYDGKKISTGKIRIVHRPRISNDISFGSFKYAFYLFQKEYDYWFFSEDDLLPLTNGIVPELIHILDNDKDTGFVGALNFINHVHTYTIDNGYITSHDHIHGGTGLTSTNKIKQVIEKIPDFLNIPNIVGLSEEEISDYNGAEGYEIWFTRNFIEAGFKLKVKNSLNNFFHLREEIKI